MAGFLVGSSRRTTPTVSNANVVVGIGIGAYTDDVIAVYYVPYTQIEYVRTWMDVCMSP